MNVRKNLSKNLLSLRKQKKLTQLELASLLNYSDKSISKWECGETAPDIDMIHKLAVFYGITIDELVGEDTVEIKPTANKVIERSNKIIITLLAISIIWVCATIIQVQMKLWYGENLWVTYIWAVPASLIALIIFNLRWGQKKFSLLLASALTWTTLTALYLQFLNYNIWATFFIGIPAQLSMILWGQLSKNKQKR